MSEMIVNVPQVKRHVTEYDFVFTNGVFPVTLDLAAGDTIIESDERVVIELKAKPSVNDPKRLIPGENITIFKRHLLSITSRPREIIELSPEEQFEWQKTLAKTHPTVQ